MKIAILGGRGIPACYSGYDTLIEELSLGLVKSNASNVIVYCRWNYYQSRPNSYYGVQLVYLPAPRIKAIESLFHSFLSSLHVILHDVDVVYFVDPANAPFCLFLRFFGKIVVVHTDGLGWKRRKWGMLARRYYKFCEWLCARIANALVTDNPVMQEYYKQEYGADSVYISYGAVCSTGMNEIVYEELGLSPKHYMLVVARLEPENNTDFVVQEYKQSNVKMPLIVVGDSPYNSRYMSRLHELGGNNVYFVGRIDDQPRLNALYAGAYLYIHGHEVGGTNPSLLRAMHGGAAPVVINVPFNTTVVGKLGFVFERKEGDLSKMLERLVTIPGEVKRAGQKAQARAQVHFRWDTVIKKHEQLFRRVVVTKKGT